MPPFLEAPRSRGASLFHPGHTVEDKTVPVENSLQFAAALRQAGVPLALHLFPKSGHGMGLGTRDWKPEARHPWTRDCEFWLREQGFAK